MAKAKLNAFEVPSKGDIKASTGVNHFRRPEGEVTVWQVFKEFLTCLAVGALVLSVYLYFN